MKLELHNQNISIASFVMDTKGEGWQRRESSSSTSVQTRARLTQEDTEGVKYRVINNSWVFIDASESH